MQCRLVECLFILFVCSKSLLCLSNRLTVGLEISPLCTVLSHDGVWFQYETSDLQDGELGTGSDVLDCTCSVYREAVEDNFLSTGEIGNTQKGVSDAAWRD